MKRSIMVTQFHVIALRFNRTPSSEVPERTHLHKPPAPSELSQLPSLSIPTKPIRKKTRRSIETPRSKTNKHEAHRRSRYPPRLRRCRPGATNNQDTRDRRGGLRPEVAGNNPFASHPSPPFAAPLLPTDAPISLRVERRHALDALPRNPPRRHRIRQILRPRALHVPHWRGQGDQGVGPGYFSSSSSSRFPPPPPMGLLTIAGGTKDSSICASARRGS